MTDSNPISPMSSGLPISPMIKQEDMDTSMIEPKPQSTVHVREDSHSELEKLFSVLQPTDSPKREVRPWKDEKRKLPSSFFTPSVRHNREASADGIGFGQSQPQSSHSRSQSSPATLPHTLSIAPATQQRQPSLDQLGPLPAGWEMSKTAEGQIYFLDHATKKTTWDDPRLSQQIRPEMTQIQPQQPQRQPSPQVSTSQQQLQQHVQPQQQQQQQHLVIEQATNPAALSPSPNPPQPQVVLNQAMALSPFDRILGPLPTGWDQNITVNGEVYFINHNLKQTSWFDPRIPRDNQRSGMKLAELHAIQNAHIQLLHQQQQQQGKVALPTTPRKLPNSVQQNQEALSPVTSMQQLRTQSPQPIRLDLQDIQRKEEELRQQQVLLESLKAQALQAKAQEMSTQIIENPQPTPTTSSVQNIPPSNFPGAISAMASNHLDLNAQPICNEDPIFGQPENAPAVSHQKQNSTDSGLGGMNSYSLPRTPEDFLHNVEEMDSQDGGQKIEPDINLNDIPIGSMDTSSTNEDDLMPSIQDDNINIPIMSNLLTWL